MSTPAQEGTQVPEGKKENGLRKLLSRARTVLRPKDRDSSKRFSTLSAKPGPSSAAPPVAGSSRYVLACFRKTRTWSCPCYHLFAWPLSPFFQPTFPPVNEPTGRTLADD